MGGPPQDDEWVDLPKMMNGWTTLMPLRLFGWPQLTNLLLECYIYALHRFPYQLFIEVSESFGTLLSVNG